jgi:tRNA C32,U32 (ribose-2'-O)-methylase TrmJ
MPNARIVLVEPQEAGNVGAVARAMKNFGLDDLRIVGSHPELLPVAGWWASGADDLVASIRFAPTLLEAIGDAHVTIATTSSRGRTTRVDMTPRDVSALFQSLGDDQTLAPAALVERLHARAEALLLEVGFLHDQNPDRLYDDLRALTARADPDHREVTILLGILRQVEWALRAARAARMLNVD